MHQKLPNQASWKEFICNAIKSIDASKKITIIEPLENKKLMKASKEFFKIADDIFQEIKKVVNFHYLFSQLEI